MSPSRQSALVAALLAVTALSCAPVKPKGRPVEYQGFYATFKSGLRLVVYENPNAAEFMFSASYDSGAADEPAGQEGIAHLAEHLAFRAAHGPVGAPSVWDRLVGGGLVFNGVTTHDHTDYWELGKPDQLQLAIAIEADRMYEPLAGIGEKELATEREVVISELLERSAAGGDEWDWLAAVGMPGHPYGRPVAGSVESLRRIQLDDVRAWFRARYGPEHAILVLTSPVPQAQAVAAVERRFGVLATGRGDARVPPAQHPPPPLPAAPPPSEELAVRHAPVDQPHLLIGWAVPGEAARNIAQAEAARAMLEVVLFIRLSVIDMLDRVDGFEVELDEMSGAALILARIRLRREEDAPRVLEFVKDQLIRLGQPDAQDRGDFLRINRGLINTVTVETRDWLQTQTYLSLERLDAPAIAQFLRISGQPDFIGGHQKQVARELATSIDSYCGRYLTRQRAFALLVAPGRDAPRLSFEAADLALDRFPDREPNLPLRLSGDAAELSRPPGFDKALRRTLSNGLQVVVLPRGHLPTADVRLIVRTRTEGTSEVPSGLAHLVVTTSRHDWKRFNGARAGAGEFLEVRGEHITYGQRGSSGNLEHLLEDVARWAREVSPYEARFKYAREAAARSLRVALRGPVLRAEQALAQRLYPDHAYGTAAVPAEWERLTVAQGEKWVEEQFRPAAATLIVAGDVEPGPELLDRIESFFGRWKGRSGTVIPPAPPAQPSRRAVAIVDRPGAKQAQLLVGLRVAGAADDEAALSAVAWHAQHRLGQQLRIDAGKTYGVHVWPERHSSAGALQLQTAVEAGVAARSLTSILGTLKDLAQTPLAPPAAERVGWQLAREQAFRFDTVHEAARGLEELTLRDLPGDYWEKYPDSIASLSAERIQAAARSLAMGREAIVIVGDQAQLVPQLRAAGFEPEVLPEPAVASR